MKHPFPCWASVALLALSLPAAARQTTLQDRERPLPTPLRDAGTYHLATGTWSRRTAAGPAGTTGAETLYRNDVGASTFITLPPGATATDEGRLPGAGQPLIPGEPEVGTSDLYTVTGFSFAYCALGAGPTTYEVEFLEAYAACTDPSAAAVVAGLQLTGLPSGGCWLLTIDLTGTPAVFDLAADGGDGYDGLAGQDTFGLRYSFDDGSGTAGPVQAGAVGSPLEGAGTKFKDPFSGGSGLEAEDLYWLDSPVGLDQCVLGRSARMVLFGEDAGQAVAACTPAGPNSVSAGGARLESLAGYGTSQARLLVSDVPNHPGLLFTGAPIQPAPFGCGQRCVGGPSVVRYGPFVPTGNQLERTIDMTLGSGTSVQYWYRDPAFSGTCGNVFNLSNALGL